MCEELTLWKVEGAQAAKQKGNPLREVLGRDCADRSDEAAGVWDSYILHADSMPCPFKSEGGLCTKNSKDRPLSVCAVAADDATVITCPHRFEERATIFDDVWQFLVGPDPSADLVRYVDREIRLTTAGGGLIGNVDFVVSAIDSVAGRRAVCSVEVQAAYISGNVTAPFEKFISGASESRHQMSWAGEEPPRPDFLSSWKRLRSQLLDKGPDLAAAEVKQAVVVDVWFLDNMRSRLAPSGWDEIEVPQAHADVALLGYDLVKDPDTRRLRLTKISAIYTTYSALRGRLEQGGDLDVAALHHTLDARLEKRLAVRRRELSVLNQQTFDDEPGDGAG